MIDGFKNLILPVDRSTLWNNPLVEPLTETNAKTGETNLIKTTAKVQGLIFTFWPDGRIELNGSLHKYFNQGLHNHNDFGLKELIITLNILEYTFGINPMKTFLNGLEIGVNIELPYSPGILLKSLILHNGKPFTDQQNKTKHFRECSHFQYYIKIYDKGKQYQLDRYILRIEVKYIKMETLNKQGIKTLSDLTKPSNFEFLGRLLLQTFDKILIGNLQADTSKLNPRDKLIFANGHNPAYWEQLIPKSENHKQGNADPEYKRQYKRYEKKLKRFKELLTITGADQQKKEIRELIVQKINQLSVLKKQGEIDRQQPTKNRGNLTDNQNTKQGEIDTLLYNVNTPLLIDKNKPVCTVTGLPILNQRPGTKYISPKGIKWYYENEPETYKKELESLLTEKWITRHSNEPMKEYYFEIYHQIRNQALNPDNNFFKRYLNLENKNPKLFSTDELMPPAKLELIKNKLNSKNRFRSQIKTGGTPQ